MKHEIGALILRLTLGIIFLAHGAVKFQGGIENVAGMFESMGLPGFLAYGVACLEVVGGIALIFGLGTQIVSALFALLMIGAIFKVKLAAGFLGGVAYDLTLMVVSIHLLLNGSKLFSVGQLIFKGLKNQGHMDRSV